MQSKPKILVLKMRELVYTGIFLFLAVVLIVLLVLMFRTEKAPEKRTSISTERYTAGVYSSPVTLGDTVVDVTVTVEIEARTRQGFEAGLQRAVKENCGVLKFRAANFEQE